MNSDVPREWDDKKQKNEQILYPNSQGKQNGKQVKDNVEAPKENYIHVRARRGQATNSHSLAERVNISLPKCLNCQVFVCLEPTRVILLSGEKREN